MVKKKLKRQTINNQLIPKTYSLESIGITQSLITTYLKCPRMFLLKLNRWKSGLDNVNTSFGNIVHYVLDRLYTTDPKKIKKLIKKPLRLNVFIASLIEQYELENENNLIGVDENEFNWEKKTAQIILKEYILYYPEDFDKKRFKDVEKEIQFEISGFRCLMKLDGRYQTKTKRTWLMEHKTKSRISEDNLMKRLTFDFQNLFYVIGAEKHFKIQVDGMLYNVIRKPQIRQKQNETEIQYFKRLRLDINNRRKFYFMRYEIPYGKSDKDYFLLELIEMLQVLSAMIKEVKYSKSPRVFWKNTNSCEFPFVCKFIDACSSGVMSNYYQGEKVFPELKTINY